jgi:hypothetical protein
VLKPRLGFNLMFHTGYHVKVPLRALAGKENVLTILFRVTAEDRRDRPAYFRQEIRVPLMKDDQNGDATLEGAYLVGQGKYQVDWLMRDRDERFCASFWDIEGRLRVKEAVLGEVVASDVVTPVEVDPFAGGVSRKKKHPGRTLSVRIAVNFNPRDPANAILTHEDIEGFSAILRIISREPRIGRYSVVACSLYTRQVIYQQDGASQIDLPHLGKSLANLSLGRVSIDQLAMNGGESDFIAGLIAGNAGEDLPDAIILISSGSEIDLKLPHNVVNQLRGSRVFYLNYDGRRDASSSGRPFGRVVRQLRGSAYTIREPRDLLIAWSEIMSRLAARD